MHHFRLAPNIWINHNGDFSGDAYLGWGSDPEELGGWEGDARIPGFVAKAIVSAADPQHPGVAQPSEEPPLCHACHGKGWLGQDCPYCNGNGRDVFKQNPPGPPPSEPCGDCGGSGNAGGGRICQTCLGTGRTPGGGANPGEGEKG